MTQADLHYVGSLTIDKDLMDAAGLVEGEQVHVVDIDNGERLVTYAVEGAPGSGVIGVNGAAAQLVSPGDLKSRRSPGRRRSTPARRSAGATVR